MNIVVNKNDLFVNEKREIISKDIICPKCKENILIDIKNYKIHLYGCKNDHNIDNILLNNYKETQSIDISKIICNICNENNKYNTHNNEFYICITCHKNICPLCKSTHNKNHIIINYDDKNYICMKHNDSFTKYCKTCQEDICIICENEHENHDLFELKKILIDRNELVKLSNDLKNIIDKFKYKINIIKEILDRMINIFEIYYKINNDIINNYNINKRNYHNLRNLYNLMTYNEITLKYIENIIKDDQIFKIYKFPNDIFYSKNGEIYIGEMKNNLKEGRGILYFKKNSKIKKYDGNFKNNKKEGKGKFYWNNGDIYEGDFRNDKMEGIGIYYYNNGKGGKYEGEFKNDKMEGKGIYYSYNGDRFEGSYKNGKREGKGIFYHKEQNHIESDTKNVIKDGKKIIYYKDGKMVGENLVNC